MADVAVFLDRDGTLVEDPGYLVDPDALTLLPGVDLALKALVQAGYRTVIVTNQSAVARGMAGEDGVRRVNERLCDMLAEKGARIDAVYYCPFHPEGTVAEYRRDSACRKPAPGMLRRAAQELDLDLASCWMVGDADRDVEAGRRAGCRTVLVSASGDVGADADVAADFIAEHIVEAARIIVSHTTFDEREYDADGYDVRDGGTSLPGEPERDQAAVTADGGGESTVPEMQAGDENETEGECDTITEDSRVRREILACVRQLARKEEHSEFSLLSLIGGLSQSLVVLFLVVAFYKAVAGGHVSAATFWALVALIFQVMSLTMYTIVGRKH